MHIEGKILNGIFHLNKLKQTFLRTTKGPVSTLVGLKQTQNLGNRITKNQICMKDCINDVL